MLLASLLVSHNALGGGNDGDAQALQDVGDLIGTGIDAQTGLGRDEAVFEKIRGNVYEIFSAVLTTARNQPAPMDFFRRQLAAIPATWEAALEKARAHGDESKAHTELLKLEAVRAIREHMEESL